MKSLQSEHAAEICKGYDAPQTVLDALAALGEDASPRALIDALTGENLHGDAATFLAHGMPPREGVWWACQVADYVKDTYKPLDLSDLIDAAKTWVRTPTDETRRTAMAKAEAADFENPASWAAAAAFWSEGSLAEPDMPEVPPPPGLYRTAIAAAITMAAVTPDQGAHASAHYQHFLTIGIDIADGGNGQTSSQGQEARQTASPPDPLTPANR
ncbi:MAG: Twin-arginine translocation pathway signal [Pseudomonadota bacterium]